MCLQDIQWVMAWKVAVKMSAKLKKDGRAIMTVGVNIYQRRALL